LNEYKKELKETYE